MIAENVLIYYNLKKLLNKGLCLEGSVISDHMHLAVLSTFHCPSLACVCTKVTYSPIPSLISLMTIINLFYYFVWVFIEGYFCFSCRKENQRLQCDYNNLQKSYTKLEALKVTLEGEENRWKDNLTDAQKEADQTKTKVSSIHYLSPCS